MITNKILIWKHIESEEIKDYVYLKDELISMGFTINSIAGKEQFTHRKLMVAYKSLHKNLPYLFTYKNRSNLQIPNTTNSLDGGVFTQLKKLIRLHQGMSRSLKMKLIDD